MLQFGLFSNIVIFDLTFVLGTCDGSDVQTSNLPLHTLGPRPSIWHLNELSTWAEIFPEQTGETHSKVKSDPKISWFLKHCLQKLKSVGIFEKFASFLSYAGYIQTPGHDFFVWGPEFFRQVDFNTSAPPPFPRGCAEVILSHNIEMKNTGFFSIIYLCSS